MLLDLRPLLDDGAADYVKPSRTAKLWRRSGRVRLTFTVSADARFVEGHRRHVEREAVVLGLI